MDEKEKVIDNEVLETNEQTESDANETKEQEQQPEKLFTQAELDEIVTKRLAREEKKRAEEVKEAQKLAKMNKDEKTLYELEQAKKQLAEYEEREALATMRKEANTMLREQGIIADDVMLDFIVTSKADDTKSNVEAFASVFNSMVKEHVEKQLQQDTPQIRKTVGLTKEDILAIPDATKRQHAIAQNRHLFQTN